MSQPKRGRSSQAQNHLITILLALVIAGLSMWFGAGRDGGNDPDSDAGTYARARDRPAGDVQGHP